MQSDGNSSCGDVVLDSFTKAFRDGDKILEQINKKQIFSDFYDENFTKMHTNITEALKTNFTSSLS